MVLSQGGIARDLALRGGGLLLAALGYFALRYLLRRYAIIGPHDPSLVELVCAAVGFLAVSGASVLIVWGARIFDRVAVSQRWARRSEGA